VRADSLFFNSDGTIQKVIPSLRGIGITKASATIQIDRYSGRSNDGTAIQFIDSLDRFRGWATVFDKTGAWVQYNSVDFGEAGYKTISMNVMASGENTVQIRIAGIDGPVLAEVKVPAGNQWKIITSAVTSPVKGIHNLFIISKTDNPLSVDWIRFQSTASSKK
jgi:hypothetical protein